MASTATITSKGQITLPRDIRKVLGTNTVEIELVDGKVFLKPVKSVAGALARYAGKDVPLGEVREKVWEAVVHDKKH